MLFRVFSLFALVAMLTLTAPQKGMAFEGFEGVEDPDEGDLITFAAGRFDVFTNQDSQDNVEFRLDYRFGEKYFGIFKPFLTTAIVTQGAAFLGGGILTDIFLTPRLVLTPQLSAVFYTGRTEELDLGADYEFRSRLELAYRFDNRARIGVSVDHTSNTGIFNDQNPGVEVASLNFSLPFRTIRSLFSD